MKWFFYLMKILSYIPFRIMYPVTIIDKKKMPKGKIIAVGNHLSAADIIMQLSNLPGFRYTIAKKELSKNKFVGGFLAGVGAIFYDRGKADLPAMKKIISVMKKGYGLSIFPEGTRNRESLAIRQIKEGAAMFAIKGQAPIVPIIVYTRTKLFHKNYLLVGDTFDLSEYYGNRVDAAVLKAASEKIEQHMHMTQNQLNDYVFYNKTKEGKLLKKQSARALKSLSSCLVRI